MKRTRFQRASACALALLSGIAAAAERKPEPVTELSDAGKAWEVRYTSVLVVLKAEIEKVLPNLDDAKIATWQQAIQAEDGPAKEAAAKAKEVEKMQGTESKLLQMEENLRAGPKTLEDAQAELQRARARGKEDPE